jgi:hypothetical protein
MERTFVCARAGKVRLVALRKNGEEWNGLGLWRSGGGRWNDKDVWYINSSIEKEAPA